MEAWTRNGSTCGTRVYVYVSRPRGGSAMYMRRGTSYHPRDMSVMPKWERWVMMMVQGKKFGIVTVDELTRSLREQVSDSRASDAEWLVRFFFFAGRGLLSGV